MAPKTIGFLHSGSFYHEADLDDAAVRAYGVRDLYLRDTKPEDIAACDSLLLAGRLHRASFTVLLPAILSFLEAPGHKVVIEGDNSVGEWLPGTREEFRPTNFWAWRTGEDMLRRNVNTSHPMWAYLTEESLHWHFHGALWPPEGAVPLVTLDEGSESPGCIAYYDDSSFAAEVFVTTMDSSYHHGAGFMPGATQLLYRTLAWLAD